MAKQLEVGLKRGYTRMNKDNWFNFVYYNYMPFSKSQCIKRLILLWFFNIPFYLLKYFRFIGISFTIINIIISVIFVYFIFKQSNTEEARFLCDGITTSYYAILLNAVAYILLDYNQNHGFPLMIGLIAFLLITTFVFLLLAYKCIKNDKFAQSNTTTGKYTIVPFGSGVLGILFARILLSNVENTQVGIIVLGLCFLFFSCVASIGTISFVKLSILRKIKTENKPMSDS